MELGNENSATHCLTLVGESINRAIATSMTTLKVFFINNIKS